MKVVIIILMIHISSLKEKIVIHYINKEKDIIEDIIFRSGTLKEIKKNKIKLLFKKIKKINLFMLKP